MIFIAVLFLSFFSNIVQTFAIPTIDVTAIPSDVIIGTTFPVSFTVRDADPNTNFYYKIFGGIGDTKTYIQTGQNLYYTGTSWSEFPNFNTDVGGSAFIETNAFINLEKPSGIYNFYIKIKDGPTSVVKTLNVIIPTPTPTPTLIPTNTPIPTSTPVPTNTPIPINTPTPVNTPIPTITKSPTSTPKPTNTPTPKITSTPTPTLTPTSTPVVTAIPTPTKIPTITKIPSSILTIEPLVSVGPTEEVLGTTDVLNESTVIPTEVEEQNKSEKKSVFNFIPTFLIVFGSLLLLTPLVLSKIKHCPKKFSKK